MYKKVDEFLAKRLKQYRKERGLPQADLANEIGVSRGSIGYYELCDRVAGIDTLAKIADHIECTIDYLLGRTDA